MGEMKKKRARGKRARGEGAPSPLARFPRARFFFISPIYFLAPAMQATGLEAPEGISVCIRRENCQSKKTRDHLYTCSRWTDKAVKFFCYITKWYNRSSDLGGHFSGTLWL